MGKEYDEKDDEAKHTHYIQLPKAIQSEVSEFECEDPGGTKVKYPGMFVLNGFFFLHFRFQSKGKGKRNRLKSNPYIPPPLHASYMRGQVPP